MWFVSTLLPPPPRYDQQQCERGEDGIVVSKFIGSVV